MASSPITGPPALLGRTSELVDVLAKVPDQRDPRGVRYPQAGMLAVVVTAVLAGAPWRLRELTPLASSLLACSCTSSAPVSACRRADAAGARQALQ